MTKTTTKKCLYCGKVIKKTNPMANNVKYCNKTCYNKALYIKKGGAEAQREYLYKRSLKDKRPKIQCQVCGKWYRQVGTHVIQAHGYESAREYREEYGFDVKKGQLPEDYRKLKATQAIECGGVKNLKKGKKYWFKKGGKGVGIYKRSEETMVRLKELSKFKKNKLKK